MEGELVFKNIINTYYKAFSHKKVISNDFKVVFEKNEITNYIKCNYYYLVENKVFWKGKNYFFKGEVTKMDKQDTLAFIEREVNDYWAREYLLLSIQPNEDLILINEEGSFFIIPPIKSDRKIE
ncbi:hypothetical protein AAG747_18200 [Rapidithrix thailandica]|uniref:Uncharacterized protein n=1 Tax=Rapidithrix thailandica TaxID=413964 RepID=A0AAW9S7L8_9BACT